MTWYIMVLKSPAGHASSVNVNSGEYELHKKALNEEGFEVPWGRKEITDDEIDKISNKVNGLVERLNKGEKLDLEKELDF